MNHYECFLASALEKVMPGRRPASLEDGSRLSCWPGEKAAVQLVFHAESDSMNMPVLQYAVEITGVPGEVELRRVIPVPVQMPCYVSSDEDYISKEPGLFPDLLEPVSHSRILPIPGQYRSLWLTFHISGDAAPGDYEIQIQAKPNAAPVQPAGWTCHEPEAEQFTCRLTLHVCAERLEKQRLLHTQWFHTDCLSSYYGVAVFSEEYWRITENFIRSAAEHGINMLLTPIFTPPLDTPVGGERPTVQLVDVIVEQGKYRFGFEKLARWTALTRKAGITHLEIPHFFTQWGAVATPKVMALVDGTEKRIFGWDVPAESTEYRRFLDGLIPQLRKTLLQLGYDDDHVYYHISDEPGHDQVAAYHNALHQTQGLLDGCHVLDALSSLDFYRQGLVRTPVCANDQIQPFLDAGVPHLWTYYCCVQGTRVPNRFIAMPSVRNRIMGVLLYLHRIEGFLQWGFNFYYSKYSLYPIDPFRVTDGDFGYPAGDSFLVYPGRDGNPMSSIRAEVEDDAFLDLRALELMEARCGREAVVRLIRETAGMNMTFADYPRDARFLLELRERVAAALDGYAPEV